MDLKNINYDFKSLAILLDLFLRGKVEIKREMNVRQSLAYLLNVFE